MPVLEAQKLTLEHQSAVEDCVVYALDLMAELDNVTMLIEQHVNIAEDCSGTADLIVYNDQELHVIDWKFGKGIEVSANENTQLMAYAFGAIYTFSIDPGNVVMHIVQPRLSNYDTYVTSLGNLERWYDHTLLPGLEACESDNPEFHPSLEACRWCPIKTRCQARIEQAFKNAEEVFAEHAALPEIDMDKVGELINKAKEIEEVIKDLKLHATKVIMDGGTVKNFKLVAGRSIRQWVDENAAIDYMSQHAELEDIFTQKFISPTQAEKLLGRGAKKDDEFQAHIYKPEGKPTLVPESAKRAPLNLSAESAFANYKE
jgi:uncharacterized Zn ribbon protein